jgi:hypothetical protein
MVFVLWLFEIVWDRLSTTPPKSNVPNAKTKAADTKSAGLRYPLLVVATTKIQNLSPIDILQKQDDTLVECLGEQMREEQ